MLRSFAPVRFFSAALLGVCLAWGAGTAGARAQAGDAALEAALAEAQGDQAAGNFAGAASALARATDLDSSVPELWANRGLMEHLSHQPAAAIRSFARALAGDPDLFTAVLFSGVDRVDLHQSRAAVPFLEHALRLQPGNADALLALGKAQIELGEPGLATATLQHAAEARPDSGAAWYALGTARLALIDHDGGVLARSHADTAWARALFGHDLLLQGRVLEAVDAFRSAAAVASPRERAVFLALVQAPEAGLQAQDLGRVRDALGGDGTPVAPSCATGETSPACSFLAGDTGATAREAAAQLAVRPADAEALFWSVQANERLATAALARFQELAPRSPATFDLTGDLFRRRLEPDRALGEYRQALAIDPHDAPALLGGAAASLAVGRSAEAIALAGTALRDDPQNARVQLLMGEAMVAEHRYAEAKPYLAQALSLASTGLGARTLADLRPTAHALIGKVEAGTGETSAAIHDLTLGMPSDTDGSVSFLLSRLYRQQGQLDLAQKAEADARARINSRRDRAATAVAAATYTPDP